MDPSTDPGQRPQPGRTSEFVRVGIQGSLGRITLNRPAKINALTLDMIAAVRAALAEWAQDEGVVAVAIDGAGERGLCAGGDIGAVYDGIRAGLSDPGRFFATEYAMNLEIAMFPKPIIALIHGITFGGGIGVAGHAAVRVVTDTSVLAMPETAIGLAPDVGGLYLLARCPGEWGTHLALTGARLGPGDAIAAGLADAYLPPAALAQLPDRLSTSRTGEDALAMAATSSHPDPAPEFWRANRQWIDECYAGDDALAILARLRGHDEPAARAAGDVLATMSPTAVAVTLRALRNAATMTLAEVLAQDLQLATRFAAGHDFPEGIRAQIVDKDRNPRWDPPTLAEVRAEEVDAHFAPA